jgi:hypothetical protein
MQETSQAELRLISRGGTELFKLLPRVHPTHIAESSFDPSPFDSFVLRPSTFDPSTTKPLFSFALLRAPSPPSPPSTLRLKDS